MGVMMNDLRDTAVRNIKQLVEKGDFGNAIKLVDELLQIMPDDVEALNIKAVALMCTARFEEAREVLDKALQLDKENNDTLYNMAYLDDSAGEIETAAQYYLKVFQNAKDEAESEEICGMAQQILKKLGIEATKKELLENADAYIYYANGRRLEKIRNKSDAALNYGLAYRHAKSQSFKNTLLNLYSNNEDLKNIFNVAASASQKRFIILASEYWNPIYQRLHHISRSLAKFGHEVIYVTPPIEATVDYENISVSYLCEYSLNNVNIVDNVKIFSPIAAKHGGKEVANNYVELVQNLLNLPTSGNKTVIITYMPYQVQAVNLLKGKFVLIYECVDDHTDFEYAFWASRNDVIWEQELMDRADAITTTAVSLFLQRKSIEGRKNVYLSRNAVNESDFIDFMHDSDDMPYDLKGIPAPRIVFAGVVYKRFDEKLFYEVVESNPDKSFVIIGPVYEGLLAKKRSNLYFLGPKKHEELKKYLKHMHIGIVPYLEDADMDVACDSIKQYEYLACGLPVITTFMPESAFDKIYTFLANTKESFNEAIQKCLELRLDKELVSDFIAKNSWNARAALLCRLASKDVSEEEQIRKLKHIGEMLDAAEAMYGLPIFKALRAVYSNIEDKEKFEELAREAYAAGKQKYIERQYLTSLLNNSKIKEFVEVASASPHIKEELKQELLFCFRMHDWPRVQAVANICIKNIQKALKLIGSISNQRVRHFYLIYIHHLLGRNVPSAEMAMISTYKEKSPLLRYLEGDNLSYVSANQNEAVYVSDIFDNLSPDFIKILSSNNMVVAGLCSLNDGMKNGIVKIPVKKIADLQLRHKTKVIVPYNEYYVKQVRFLAEKGISECHVGAMIGTKLFLVDIDRDLMQKIRRKEYYRTITFSKYHAADSNIHALLKYMPEEYKQKYRVNVIYGDDVELLENVVKVPLISVVTVSGFAKFLYYSQKLTYNIEVWHGGVSLKTCGLMDKKNKNSGGSPEVFERADCVCTASHLSMVVFSSFFAIPENKYEITGLPRNDMLFREDGRKNLERLLGISLDKVKVVFNMPTFRVFDQFQQGGVFADSNDSFKMNGFDYERFNSFLKRNNMICVSKVHHCEEVSIYSKTKDRKYDSLFFIDNKDLERKGLDLYEVLGGGDVLITDYSSVYNDFLMMGKPTVFVIPDIEEYRQERGLALEPYEFWTAGPKVQTQEELENELLRCVSDPEYYRAERERLLPVFFKYTDANSTQRVWDVIDRAFSKVLADQSY